MSNNLQQNAHTNLIHGLAILGTPEGVPKVYVVITVYEDKNGNTKGTCYLGFDDGTTFQSSAPTNVDVTDDKNGFADLKGYYDDTQIASARFGANNGKWFGSVKAGGVTVKTFMNLQILPQSFGGQIVLSTN